MNPDKNKEFDKQLAGKFDNFRPEVPRDLWGKIASKLDQQEQQDSTIPIKQRRRFPTWWISVAASVSVVCAIVYWFNRPVTVTYLQNPVAHLEKPETPAVEKPVTVPAPEVEPLDIDRLKRLFAKRNRKSKNENQQEIQVPETPLSDRTAGTIDNQSVIVENAIPPAQALAKNDDPATPISVDQTPIGEAVAATVPDIQPPVVLEDEEETLLASTEASKQPFGVSNILNYVVGAVDQREEKLVTFSNDSEGTLKLDFNFSLAKNKKKRIK
ncbi:hypothetical protein [Parapedobacter sp.]